METKTPDYGKLLILTRAIQPERGDWSVETANSFLTMRVAPVDCDRMHALARLAQAGKLSPVEEIEIENYRQVTGVLTLLHAKALVSLAAAKPG
ncbi:MAG TPA: hypothetical protein VFE47_32175 [Tepidisphaeraceae bacterium]|jgi:hypothetical protein|nr:hypothetical protein [Tepidisphaeraceae bacterium]